MNTRIPGIIISGHNVFGILHWISQQGKKSGPTEPRTWERAGGNNYDPLGKGRSDEVTRAESDDVLHFASQYQILILISFEKNLL